MLRDFNWQRDVFTNTTKAAVAPAFDLATRERWKVRVGIWSAVDVTRVCSLQSEFWVEGDVVFFREGQEFGVEGHFIVMGLKVLRDGFPIRPCHRQGLRVKRRTAKNEATATSTAPIPPLRDGRYKVKTLARYALVWERRGNFDAGC